MKNLKVSVILTGLLIGAGLHAGPCSDSGVTVQNTASVPGVSYTLYVNIGDKPSKRKAGILPGYEELKPGKSVCFKKGFEESTTMYVRAAHAKGMPKNEAFQFDIRRAYDKGLLTIRRIEIKSGNKGFELEVYGHDEKGASQVRIEPIVKAIIG